MYIIQDWYGYQLNFNGRFESPSFAVPMEFKTFEDAWEYIFENTESPEDWEDVFVVEKGN